MDWRTKAEELFKQHGREWSLIATELLPLFPSLKHFEVKEKVRSYLRRKYSLRAKQSVNADGVMVSEKFISLRDGQEMTPAFLLQAHGLEVGLWEVVSYKNNLWTTASGETGYQSKLTARPIKTGISLAAIDAHFKALDREKFIPPVIKPAIGAEMAEVNIADLHLGKLSWHGETGVNYDYKIAREVFYSALNDVIARLKGRPISYITFVWANDFFNADTIGNTTTGLTPQDCDVRWQKMFNVGVEMLVRGIEMLAAVAPVKTFYTPSNHDEVNGYHALKYLEAWFRKDPNIEIDISAYPRKYMLYGKTLIGYCHGHNERQKGNRYRASQLAAAMPVEVPDLWAKSQTREFHTAHLHSEQAVEELNGVIVRRIASPTASDAWHTRSGYIGAVRKIQTFVYSENKGLLDILNTPIV